MSVKLRLTRMGKKKQPFYRIVAADSRTRRDGKYIDKVGYYNPLPDPAIIELDEEKVFLWLERGAILSDTVKNIFSKKGIMLKWDLMQKGTDKKVIEEEYKKWELLQLERQKKAEALAAQEKRQEKKQVEPAEEPEAKSEEVEVVVEEAPVAEEVQDEASSEEKSE